MEEQEIKAGGYWFGWENLGMATQQDTAKVWELAKNGKWKEIVATVEMQMQSTAESDETYDGFNGEIKEWIRNMRNDQGTIEMWDTFKKTGQ